MLHLLRRAAKTWVFRILFGLLIASFAVWGVGDLSFGGAGNRVATVGEEKVTVEDFANAMMREMRSVSRRTGENVDIEQARLMGLPDALLGRMVRDAALNDEARRLGLSAGDAALRDEILASPSFKGLDGSFDDEQYRFILNQLGFSVDRFEDDLRKSLARDVVSEGVMGGAHAAPGLAEKLAARALEQRGFMVLSLALADAPDPGAPTPEQAKAQHEAHQDLYAAPETRQAVWIAIDPEALAEGAEVDEDELRAAYDAAADEFDMPERRAVDRIVYPDAESAAEAMARIDSGASTFEGEAEARGLSAADADLGEVAERDLPAAAAPTVFSADLGPVGPVETGLGPAIYNIRAILPARVTPFEDAKAVLRPRVAASQGHDLAAARAEQAADLLASGASIESIAEELGLPLASGPVTREGGAEGATGAAATVEFTDEVFAAEPGEERDIVETQGGGYVLVRVDEVTEAAPRPLDEVRAQVEADWAEAQRRESLRAIAKDAAARLEAGESFPALAAELNPSAGATPFPVGPARRGQTVPGLPAEAMETLFDAPDTGAAAVADTAQGVTIARLDSIEPADLDGGEGAQLLERWRQALDASVGQDLYVYYAAAVQERSGAEFNPQAMEQAINAIR